MDYCFLGGFASRSYKYLPISTINLSFAFNYTKFSFWNTSASRMSAHEVFFERDRQLSVTVTTTIWGRRVCFIARSFWYCLWNGFPLFQACEVPASQNEHSHYVCTDNGEVKCLRGWTGDVCDVPICRKGCDPLQGYCKRPGECLCKLGALFINIYFFTFVERIVVASYSNSLSHLNYSSHMCVHNSM